MTGTIKSYSEELGEGVITSIENMNYKFNTDSWSTASWLPSVGLLVEFDIEGNRAKNISVNYNTDKETKKTQETKQPNLPTYSSTYAIDKSLKNYFLPFNKVIDKYRNMLLVKNELDYLKIKRFLFTAYNNLTEIHSGFQNDEMMRYKHMIDETEQFYSLFNKQTEHLKTAFSKIFLSKQESYKKLELQKEDNKNKILTLKRIIKQAERTIEEKPDNCSKSKKEMVDAIHESRMLMDENAEIIEKLEYFEKVNYDAFKDAYLIGSKKCDATLKKILNTLAYRLDKSIWESANRSPIIQNYFAEAGITGKFSSSAYLKYYINSLDVNKMGNEARELRQILLYFQSKDTNSTNEKDEQIAYEMSHSMKALLKVKNKIPLFKGLNQQEVIHVTDEVNFLKLAPEEILLRENDLGEEVYFIIDGEFSVQVFDKKSNKNIEVATMEKNSIVGEIAPIVHQRRSATIQAKSNATVISFTVNLLQKAQYPKTYIKLYENFMDLMAQKLVQNNQKIQNLSVVELDEL